MTNPLFIVNSIFSVSNWWYLCAKYMLNSKISTNRVSPILHFPFSLTS